MKLLPFQFFSMGFDSGSRWWWFVGLIWRHGGEIGECVGWIFGLQFCFDGWWFLLDGCGFASIFFSSCSGLDQSPVSAWLRFCFCNGWLFLWWLVVILVDGCGYTLGFFFFFSSCRWLWLPQWCYDLWWWWLWWVVVATMVVMASGAVVGVVEEVVALVFCVVVLLLF